MICKLICHGRNRLEAIQRMNRSLDEFVIEELLLQFLCIKNY